MNPIVQLARRAIQARNADMACSVYRIASLMGDFDEKIKNLGSSPSPDEVRTFRQWFRDAFSVGSKAPKGLTQARKQVDDFWKKLELFESGEGLQPGAFASFMDAMLNNIRIKEYMVELESSVQGRSSREYRTSQATYLNLAGASDARFMETVETVEKALKSIKGLRRKVLSSLTINFLSAQSFRGTASAKYFTAKDEIGIRLTPGGRIQKAEPGKYGSLAYVITHELGHRYERKTGTPIDFEQSEWYTTRYSRVEGETFAELFALSNYDIVQGFDPSILDRFEQVMAG